GVSQRGQGILRDDLYGRPLDPRPRGLPGIVGGARCAPDRGRASLSRLAPPSAFRPRRAGRRTPSSGNRLPSRGRPRRSSHRPARLRQHRVAQRRLPGLRGLHGLGRVSAGARPGDRPGARPADDAVVRRSGAVALPSPPDRRRPPGTGRERESHPRSGPPGSAHAVGARAHSHRGRRALSGRAARPAGDVLAPGPGALSSGRPTPTRVVGVRIDGSIGGRLDAWLVLVSEALARLRLAHARERQLARSDALTGAPNARAFYEVAEAEITRARRYAHPFSVAYLDLDDFKLVNDRLGHLAGDAVLRSVARALSGVMRASDVVARLGGDEFVVLLPEASAAPARLATEKLRGALADVVPAHGWRMTASIGVATFLVPPESVDELLGAVDGLMYRAKQGGKNGVAHETRNEAPAVR